MRPMSMRQMHALCYESGIEFDPANVPRQLVETAEVIAGHPAYSGHTLAQQLYERRLAERERRKKVPDWFSAQDVVWEPWEREVTKPSGDDGECRPSYGGRRRHPTGRLRQ